MKYLVLIIFFIPLLIFGQKYSNDATKLFKSGVTEFKNGNEDQALKLFSECVQKEPTFAEAHLNISVIQYNKGNYKDALSASLKALHLKKSQENIISQTGKCYFQNEMYDSAAFYLDQSVSMGANNQMIYFMLADANYRLKSYSNAKKNIDKFFTLNSNSFEGYLLRGNIYFELGDNENALKDYEKAYSIDSKQTIIYANMANVYLALDENEKAFESINKGINQSQGEQKVAYLILMGNYYFNIQDLENAEKYYNDAFNLDAENPIILTNQASVLLEKNEYQAAWDKCNSALEIDQSFMQAYFNRGIANEMLRNLDEACADWQEAFILGSDKAEEFLNSPICNE